MTLNPSLVIQNQSIGVASTAQGFSDVDGILGIGPVDLTSGNQPCCTVPPRSLTRLHITGTVSSTSTVPTVTDNLFKQGTISTDSIGISYEPSTGSDVMNGELDFGGNDTSKWVSISLV